MAEMGRKKKSRVSREEEEAETGDDARCGGDYNQSSSEENNLYEVLGVERTASPQDIKKAYHRLALRLHDSILIKIPMMRLCYVFLQEAKEKFQQLQKVISILGDEEKRAVYDQTGCVDDASLAEDIVQNLRDFFKAIYKKVTEADVEEFESNYRGSDSEKKDLIELYRKFKGKMNRLFCSMFCSDPKLDSCRFKDILDNAIAAGELKSTTAYEEWAKQVPEIKPPTSPLKRRQKSTEEIEVDSYAVISQRQNEISNNIWTPYSGKMPATIEDESDEDSKGSGDSDDSAYDRTLGSSGKRKPYTPPTIDADDVLSRSRRNTSSQSVKGKEIRMSIDTSFGEKLETFMSKIDNLQYKINEYVAQKEDKEEAAIKLMYETPDLEFGTEEWWACVKMIRKRVSLRLFLKARTPEERLGVLHAYMEGKL